MEQIPASKILDALRCVNTEDLLVALQQEHPTNQQLLAKNVFAMVDLWSKKYTSGAFDLRNEATCTLASEMMEGKDVEYLPYI